MLIYTQGTELSKHLKTLDATIGFVPTMGALHEGHLSLIAQSKAQTDITVCSIFVNPTQFNNAEDLAKYPRTTEKDIQLLIQAGCDILYLPDVADVYPNGPTASKVYELGSFESLLEGTFRPGHFQGVAQVVDRLLFIVAPHQLFLGQKDLQQVAIISTMAVKHHPAVNIHTVPTLRDADGLAKSSRNQRLNIAERAIAPLIYQCLVSIQAKQGITPFSIVKKECIELLETKGLQVEYLELINRNTFESIEDYDAHTPMAAVIAVYNGNVRLIDNILL